MLGGLDSWNDTATRSTIEDFVARVSRLGTPDYVDPDRRIAVFDNDGTLWPEKPIPIQLDFTIRRLAELARDDSDRRRRQPWKAACENDTRWLHEAMVKHYRGDDADLGLLMAAVSEAFEAVTVESYDHQAQTFFATAFHPVLRRPYRACAYRPMVELLGYLREHDFSVYIASGGDRDFMRSVADHLYGVPPERVIGSALGLTYTGDGNLLYRATMDVFDDGPEKPVRIWSRIGRRPILAVGNANGDLPMLEFSGGSGLPVLRAVVHHDDPDREFADSAGSEQILARAHEQDWTVVSIKDDWNAVFTDAVR